MTEISIKNTDVLYNAQEKAYTRIRNSLGKLLADAKLCGGTPLSRCYLQHRISYDLDFFVPPMPGLMRGIHDALGSANIGFAADKMQINNAIYSNLFGKISVSPALKIEVSFVEDRWFSTYPKLEALMGNTTIVTEPVEGQYFRKLHTVAGQGTGEMPVGGRQTARDIFDLYVLSKTVKPLPDFLKEVTVFFPVDAFYNGLASVKNPPLTP